MHQGSARLAKFARHRHWSLRAVILTVLLSSVPAMAADGPAEAATKSAPKQVGALVDGAAEWPLSLAYVPAQANLVLSIRPADILAQPAMSKLARTVKEAGGYSEEFGVSLDHVEQATFTFLEFGPRPPATITLRLTEPGDALGLVRPAFADSVEQQHAGRKYRRSSNGRTTCLLPPGSRTVVFCENEQVLHALLDAGEAGATGAPWAAQWKEVAQSHVGLYIRVNAFRQLIQSEFADWNRNDPGFLPAFAPVWENSTTVVAGAKLDDKLRFTLQAACPTANDARAVAETLAAARTLGRNWLVQLRRFFMGLPAGGDGEPVQVLVDEGSRLLEHMAIEAKGTNVEVTASSPTEAAALALTSLIGQSLQAAAGARRAQSQNNLKQIALAFHNYHDVHGRFPPAVLFGQGGKGNTPHGHSWRVAILPFLDHADLYNAYKFDEPWDSPDNKKILEKMPAVFRDPYDPPDSIHSSYYGLIGEGTIFSGKEGARIQDITDGTSNTLMVVEAVRDIPWTKPQDIPYDAKQAPPGLGGHNKAGFLTAFCDGSVRLISNLLAPETIHNLIRMNDGNPIDLRDP